MQKCQKKRKRRENVVKMNTAISERRRKKKRCPGCELRKIGPSSSNRGFCDCLERNSQCSGQAWIWIWKLSR